MINLETIKKLDKIHPYPAKFTAEIATKYIQNYSNVGERVFDPFVGSGTTLLSSTSLDRIGLGTDINHIAILISKFKLLKITIEEFSFLSKFLDMLETINIDEVYNVSKPFYYESIEHWFQPDIVLALSFIKEKISSAFSLNPKLMTYSNTILSAIINIVSNQESDTRYAAIKKENLSIQYVIECYCNKFEYLLEILLNDTRCDKIINSSQAILYNSKKCSEIIDPLSIDLLLTSPPYPNTYDYYLYHKHRMNWLELDVKYSMKEEIGSRREYSSLKTPISKFNQDMTEIFSECNKVLKNNGTAIFIMGDGKIQGAVYDAKSNFEEIASRLNWSLVGYEYTNLDETSRSFRQSFRTKGKKEHILIFQKRVK